MSTFWMCIGISCTPSALWPVCHCQAHRPRFDSSSLFLSVQTLSADKPSSPFRSKAVVCRQTQFPFQVKSWFADTPQFESSPVLFPIQKLYFEDFDPQPLPSSTRHQRGPRPCLANLFSHSPLFTRFCQENVYKRVCVHACVCVCVCVSVVHVFVFPYNTLCKLFR